jgi:NAD(P)H-flavin reductase/hemoglobin-like flavoprotein
MMRRSGGVWVSTGSGSGSGADQHLLALLRAIRLRQAAPDAVAAGIADTAAALTEMSRQRAAEAEQADGADSSAPPAHPPGERPGSSPGDRSGSAPPGEHSGPLPPGTSRLGSPSVRPPATGKKGPSFPSVRPSWASPGSIPADPASGPPLGPDPADPSASGPVPAGPASPGQTPSGPASPRSAAIDATSAAKAGSSEDPADIDLGGIDSGPGRADPGSVRPAAATPELVPKDFFGRARKPATPPAPGAGGHGLSDDGPPALPGAGPAHVDHPGVDRPGVGGGGAVRPATPGSSALSGGFEEGIDEAGRPSRNRFAGLSPQPKPPPAAEERPGEPSAPPGRPRWASGEHGNTIDGSVSAGSPASGPHAPRVPGLDTPHLTPPVFAAPGRAGAAGDGMDPADDELLRETQRMLSTSLTFAGGPDDVAERFRDALLQGHPALLAAIPGDAEIQIRQLARALTWLVHHLDRPPVLVDGCGRLGAALAACGVTPDQPQMIGAALAEAMRAGMPGGAWRQDFDVAWRSTWQHVHEWIRHGGVAQTFQPATWTARVVGHDLRRHDLAVVRLRPSLPMPFRPGQYARIEVPELPGIWRPYSLSGAPRRDDVIELHVRAKTQSGVSGTLVYRTEIGDELRIGRPEGTMGLPAAERDLLMIAGDTGVAPFKALLTELADTGDPRSAVLFWGVRNLNELYDIKQITEITRAARRATVVPVVSEGNPGPYASGLVTDAVAAYGEWTNHEVYLAGPPLMLAATNAALHKLGVAPHHIHHDAPE